MSRNISYEAWARNAIAFIREKGLEREFTDWCGGWPAPIETGAVEPEKPLTSGGGRTLEQRSGRKRGTDDG